MRGSLEPPCNAVGLIDRFFLGEHHLYQRPVYRRTKVISWIMLKQLLCSFAKDLDLINSHSNVVLTLLTMDLCHQIHLHGALLHLIPRAS